MIKLNHNPKAVSFHYEKVNQTFESLITKGYVLRNKKQKKICKEFINFLIKNKEDLISALPNRLLEIHHEFEKKIYSNQQKILIKSFFLRGYEKFQNKDFLNNLGIDTCIYCNRNYTLYFGGNYSRAELDHWFPKSEFPILALSLYNLIPSCHSCNHIKGAQKKYDWNNALNNLNHPYLEKNDFKFSYNYKSYLDYNLKIEVEENSKTDKTLNSIKSKIFTMLIQTKSLLSY